MKLQDKVAIVTGAGSGIGEGIALRFAREGATIVVAELEPQKAEATVTKINAVQGKGFAVPTKVARVQDVERLVDQVLQNCGRLDILVNNAGIGHAAPIVEMRDEEWQATLDTNLTGGFFCLRRVAQEMIKGKVAGAIINISSVAGMRGIRSRAAYCAAKAGLILLTQVAALELAPHQIRVNAIAPGLIETPLTARFLTGEDQDSRMMAEKIVASIPLGRWGQPADVAAAALYLASEEAAYVTGTTLVVDAGLTAS